MIAPKLNRKLVLEEAQRVPDGAGGYLLSWHTKGTLWAAIEVTSGREQAGESVTISTVRYKVIVRAAPGGAPSRPRPEQRFRDGSRVYRIAAVSEADATGRYLICSAVEEVLS